jgi:DNA-binding beta-propeller fold protein YncE
VTGFLAEDGKTYGRPVGVTVDPQGALIVADDLSNTIWRVTPLQRLPVTEAPSSPSTPTAEGAAPTGVSSP